MAEKCKASYKNLNLIQSFSEQGYATLQLMQQACMNDEWLRQRVEQLNYLSPPAVRKWFKTKAMMDTDKSYGCRLTSTGFVVFDNATEKLITIDFSKPKLIDWDKTTANVMSYVSNQTELEDDADEGIPINSNYHITHVCQLHTLRHYNPKKYDYSTATATADTGVNSAWYVGFDKSKNYYVRPDWIADWKDEEIPSVCRAQTFKAKATGLLESVDLILDYTGTTTSNCGSPLYVQIWKTFTKEVQKTRWNTTTLEMEDVYENGEPVMENVAWLDTVNSGINKPLAEAVFDPSSMTNWGFPNIRFDKPCRVVKGNSYAIVLFSPLSEWAHCPRWGGWGRNCRLDQKYPDGHAFLSEDNGRTWLRFGKNEERSLAYKLGRYVPQDFAFQCHIETSAKNIEGGQTWDEYYDPNTEWLYLKPIFANEIYKIHFSVDDNANNQQESNVYVDYEYSIDGRQWFRATQLSIEYELPRPSKILFVRVRLARAVDGNGVVNDVYRLKTPKINSFSIRLFMNESTEMYLRTHYYQARLGDMLGASLWGRVYAPFRYLNRSEVNGEFTVNCNVEIIQSLEPTDHFEILTYDMLESKLEELGALVNNSDAKKAFTDEYNAYIDGITKPNMNAQKKKEFTANFLTMDLLNKFKRHSIYFKPAVVNIKQNNSNELKPFLYKFSFARDGDDLILETWDNTNEQLGGISFTNNVAYPILECMLYPNVSDATGIAYGEWYDYTFDYDNNELIFYFDVLQNMSTGILNVTYNKTFIDGLTLEEVGVRVDDETGLREEGLILDYFKETIPITNEHVATRTIPLRVEPVDPIREAYLDKDTEDEMELYEDYHYQVDIENNALIFYNMKGEDNNASLLKEGSVLTIVYTPNLDDERICIGYYAKRKNTSANVQIDSNYIEYKV